jgi:hypothetical protein
MTVFDEIVEKTGGDQWQEWKKQALGASARKWVLGTVALRLQKGLIDVNPLGPKRQIQRVLFVTVRQTGRNGNIRRTLRRRDISS